MKKNLKTLPLLLLAILLTSCSTVRVAADYDKAVAFDTYKTFAFSKSGIDKAEINDLDKKRILRAIEAELLTKGFSKSDSPDMLVSIFTKSSQQVNVINNNLGFDSWRWGNFGWNTGFGPHWRFGWNWANQPMTSTSVQGILFIDLIDATKKDLIWQGQGTGYLTRNIEKKDERIKEFVSKIMEKYPPGQE